MNILILTYQGDIAGSTYSISYLARGLAGRGHNVYVGCRKQSLLYRLLKDSDATCIPMEFRSKFSQHDIRHIRNIVQSCDIDIINAQSSKDRYLSIFANLFFSLDVPVIHTRRQMAKSDGGLLQRVFYEKLTAGTVAVSEEVRKSLVKKGYHKKNIKVIHNGTPSAKYESVNPVLVDYLRRRYCIGPDDLVIGVVARRKDQFRLVQALAYLPFRVTILFVGIQHQDIPELENTDTGDHRLIFTGILEPQEALAHFPLFDMKVLPSRMEGLSQTLLEAMYLGIPVIATAAGGNLSLIYHGENGLLFDHQHPVHLAEQIERLASDKSLREKLIRYGKDTARNRFSITRTVESYETYFTDILVKNMRQHPSWQSAK